MAYESDRARRALSVAVDLHRDFFGRMPQHVAAERLARPRALVELGELLAVVYRARRGSGPAQRYVHFFEQPPRLLADAQGRQLVVTGGRWRVTRRGIEG